MGWLVCQYSRAGPVSSEKHQMTSAAGVAWRGGYTAGAGTVTVVMCGSWPWFTRLMVSSLRANPWKSERLRTLWRWYLYETLLEGLAQDLQDMAAELRQFIQNEDAVVRQRHFAGHRDLPAPDQPHIGDGVAGGRDTAAS
jgi:hypothetical protein